LGLYRVYMGSYGFIWGSYWVYVFFYNRVYLSL
jgi:hypothetical protein